MEGGPESQSPPEKKAYGWETYRPPPPREVLAKTSAKDVAFVTGWTGLHCVGGWLMGIELT